MSLVQQGTSIRWRIPAGGQDRRRLRCLTCQKVQLEVWLEPVARKRHTRSGHKLRVVARCPKCGDQRVIRYGA